MHLSSGLDIPDGLLAATALVAENSRLGVPASTHTLHPGLGFVISNTELGLRGSLYDDGVGSRCTGKERDAESGLDNFGARYFGSNMGRFMSPDWSDDPDPIPHADTSNPQSLNRYAYVLNNPLSNTDPDGHACVGGVDDDRGGETCAQVDAADAEYARQGKASVTVTAQPTGGFDPGSLAAGVFGPQSASTWNNAAGTVNAAGQIEMSIMAPWAGAAVNCMSGGSKASCVGNMALAVIPGIGGS